MLPNARLLAKPGPRSSSRVAPPRAGRCRVITDDRFRGWSRCDGDSHLGTGPAADRSARLIMWLRMRSGYRLAGPPLRLRSAMRARRDAMRSRSARCRGMVSPTAAVPHRERVLPRREERIELRAHKRGGVISRAGRIYRGERSPSECYVYVLGPDGPEPLTPREAGILARPSRGGSQASVRRSWLGRSFATPRVTRDSLTTGARTSVARSSAGFPWTSSG